MVPLSESSGRKAARFARLARKELRETLRDRRTILTLVLMPLFVYPLLGLTFERFLLSQATSIDAEEGIRYVVAFDSDEDRERFHRLATASAALAPAEADERPDWFIISEEALAAGGIAGADAETLVSRGFVDLGVRWDGARGAAEQLEILYNPESSHAREAKEALLNVVARINEREYQRRLRDAGGPAAPRLAVETNPVDPVLGASATMATVIPFILLLMTATGAVYPAIDLTAGERERGTLESLIAAPVSRRAVLGAKYVAVLGVAVLTAGMNLIAMTATAFSLGLDQFLFHEGLTAMVVVQVIGLVLVLAAFFSALVLLVTSFARSFKEAQAYLIPLMMLSLAPGILSLMPELELTVPLAVTPLVGIVLLARDVLTGTADGLLIVACVGSTMLYAAVALLLAARIFGTDAVLYGSGGTWRELFERPAAAGGVPPVTMAMATLAAVFPLFLLLGPLPARWDELGVSGQLIANGVLIVLLFLMLPSAATALCRANWRLTFFMRRTSPAGWIGAALLGAALWPFAFELEMLVLSSERVEDFEELFAPIKAQLEAIPLAVKLITLALIPAVCEEWFFRGFLFSSLRDRLSGVTAVIATGLLFGVFHVVVREGLFLERMVPTAFLGIILGFVCLSTGSIWPGMLLHALHNGLIISIATFEEELSAGGLGGGERSHLPASWLLGAAVLVIAGEELIRFAHNRRRRGG